MREKSKLWIYTLVFLGLLVITSNCKKKDDNNPTSTGNTVSDKDGNIYHTITIGKQTWMVENLKTTRFNDGKVIPKVTDPKIWLSMATSAYCWYNNDTNFNKAGYGILYNWYTINTGKLCPNGWHVPTEAEWTTLINYLGGEGVAGCKLKEPGFKHWFSPNTCANDSSGFSAFAGGYRDSTGVFDYYGYSGFWWSSSLYSSKSAWVNGINYGYSGVTSYGEIKNWGFSIRCIRN